MSITEELTKELLEELNCDTAFTIPVFGSIAVPEAVVVTWIIMALLIVISILLTRNLKVRNPGKVQLALESGYQLAENFFGELLGKNGLKYLPYLISVLLYIACVGSNNRHTAGNRFDKLCRKTGIIFSRRLSDKYVAVTR